MHNELHLINDYTIMNKHNSLYIKYNIMIMLKKVYF